MSFDRAVLGRTGLEVCRLGVASTYGAPARAVERAFDAGVNYFYWGTLRRNPFADGIRNLASQRDRFLLVVQSYSRVASLIPGSLERALRELKSDRADILLLGLWNREAPNRFLDQCRRLVERGLVRRLGLSTHHRPLAARLAGGSEFDVLHLRYNAVHVKAEREVFPHLTDGNRPGIVCFTATYWRRLLDSKRMPAGEQAPTAGDCYRFVLSNPAVDVCLTGPSNEAQMEHALEALRRGPLSPDETVWMRRVGEHLYGRR